MKVFRNQIPEKSFLEMKWKGDSVRVERDDGGLYLYVNDISVSDGFLKGTSILSPEERMENLLSRIYGDLDGIKYGDEGIDQYLYWEYKQFGPGGISGNVIYRLKPKSPAENTYIYQLHINKVMIHTLSSDDESDIILLINKAKNIQKCCLMLSLLDSYDSSLPLQEIGDRDSNYVVEYCFFCCRDMKISLDDIRKSTNKFFKFICPYCGFNHNYHGDFISKHWLSCNNQS